MIQIHTVSKNTPLGNEKMKIDTFPIIDFLFLLPYLPKTNIIGPCWVLTMF